MARSLSCSTIALVLAFSPLRAAPTPAPGINRASKILTAEEASQILCANAEPSLRNQLRDAEEGRTWTSTASWSTNVGMNRKTLTLLVRYGQSGEETQKAFELSRDVLKGDPSPISVTPLFALAIPRSLTSGAARIGSSSPSAP